MKDNYSTEGSYHSNDGEEKDFEIDYSNHPENEKKHEKLIQLLHQPWRLIKEGGELGVTGVKRFFTILFLFAFSNTALFFFAVTRLIATDFEFGKLIYILLVLALGIGITVHAGYRAYNYVIIDTIRVIYENLTPFFKKMSAMIVDRIEARIKGKKEVSEDEFKKVLDFGQMVNTQFKKTPKFLRNGLIVILKKIPFAKMLNNIKADILSGDKAKASELLYSKMDSFISETIFGGNNTRWVLWLLPANIVLIVVLILNKIG